MEHVFEIVVWLIYDSGLSNREIARRTGVERTTINAIANGQHPLDGLTTATLIKLYEFGAKKYDAILLEQ